jgi:adenosylcobinamide amidohydrolase
MHSFGFIIPYWATSSLPLMDGNKWCFKIIKIHLSTTYLWKVTIDQKDMTNKLKRIYEIVFNLKKNVLCSTVLKTISFAQSCTSEVYIYDPNGIGNLNCILKVLIKKLW